MKVRPLTDSLSLNPAEDPAEVWSFLHEAFEGRFEPAFKQDYHGDPEPDPSRFEGRSSELRATILLPEREAPRDYRIQHGNEAVLEYRHGAYSIGERSLLRFALPCILKNSHKELVVDWSEMESALAVHFTRHKEPNPSFLVTIHIGHGLWGTRHEWLRAMEHVFREDLAALGAWQQGKRLLESLSGQAEELERVEKEVLNVARVRSSIRASLARFRARYSNEPTKNGLGLSEESWVHCAWKERFLVEGECADRAIQYWGKVADAESVERLVASADGGEKLYWPDLARILTLRPESEAVIRRLLGWLADFNWPGCGVALEHLHKVGRRWLPLIHDELKNARADEDEDYAEALQDLLADL